MNTNILEQVKALLNDFALLSKVNAIMLIAATINVSYSQAEFYYNAMVNG